MNQSDIKNRRRFPRIETDLSLEVRSETGLVFGAKTKNLSQIGLMFATSRDIFEQLTINQRQAEKSQPAEVEIKLILPMKDATPVTISARGRLFQLRRVSSDCYHIGLEYMELTESDYCDLSRYFESVTTIHGRSQQLC